MLPDVTLPASLAGLLVALRPCFSGPSFRTFCGLAAGLCGQVRRRTVCGMLLGAGLSRVWPHDRAHYFFARARWEIDELGLSVARLAVALLVAEGAPLVVAVDDSLFRRRGRKVAGAAWQHDGSSPARAKVGFGTCFVTAGIVVSLPFCARRDQQRDRHPRDRHAQLIDLPPGPGKEIVRPVMRPHPGHARAQQHPAHRAAPHLPAQPHGQPAERAERRPGETRPQGNQQPGQRSR